MKVGNVETLYALWLFKHLFCNRKCWQLDVDLRGYCNNDRSGNLDANLRIYIYYIL
jgi:retron-type reverse transcriptase